MQRHILGIILAALVFFASNRSTELYWKYCAPFRAASNWSLEHFGKFHARAYKSWDGQILKLYCYTHDSEQEARDWFSELLSDATKVLGQSPFLNDSGEQVGDRAVVIFPHKSYRGRVSAVILVKGVNVYMIFGESLSQVLEFEKTPDIRRHNLTSPSTWLFNRSALKKQMKSSVMPHY